MNQKKVVELTPTYVENLLKTGDTYTQVIEVGKEDKFWTAKQIMAITSEELAQLKGIEPKVGDVRVKGIRTIWEELITPHVFTVCFKKADKDKTKKQFGIELENQQDYAISLIDKAKKDKKSMAEAYKIALKHVQDNPVLDYIPGEERVLRGYKIQFTSRDGKYDCVDIDIEIKGTESAVRPVNINTISYLIFNDVKYVVK